MRGRLAVRSGHVGGGGAAWAANLAACALLLLLAAHSSAPSPSPPAMEPDLDIDSDNSNPGFSYPDRSAYEDEIEDVAGNLAFPGKFVMVNDGDDDGDGIPDFADGFNWDEQYGNDDDADMGLQGYEQLILELPEGLDLSKALIYLSYAASYPGSASSWGVSQGWDPPTYYPAWGALRLWSCLGPSRDPRSCKDGGHFVPPDVYEPWQLGISPWWREVTLAVEAVVPSTQLADTQIAVYVDPDGWYGPQGFLYTDAVRVTCARIDLDVDSDNTNGYGLPSRSDYEDQIEDAAHRPELPGKLIAVNDNDDDGDGIPDFADGFNADGSQGNADDATPGERFIPLILEVPHPLWSIPGMQQDARLTFTYDASDPAQVTLDPTTGVYAPAPGTLRLWRKEGALPRSKASAAAATSPGDFVPSGVPIPLAALGLGPSATTVTLYVECVRNTSGPPPARILASLRVPGPAGLLPPICSDAVRLRPFGVDLDVDSDNASQFAGPDHSAVEEAIEDVTGDDARPGKVVLVGNGDSDRDGLPDYADGFDWLEGNDLDDFSQGSHFVPLVLQLPGGLALDRAEVEFTYSASDPAGVAPTLDEPYYLPPGHLRMWKKDGSLARDKRGVAEGGDFVAPGVRYSPAQLGADWYCSAPTLYVEAVRESATTADLPITVTFYPLGSQEPNAPACSDTVRITATRIQVVLLASETGEAVETQALSATRFPQQGAAEDGWDAAPGAVAAYRIKVYDPRQGITRVRLDGQDIALEPEGGTYATPPFLGILPGDQAPLDADEPFLIQLDEITEREYNAHVLPGDAAADPAPWNVTATGGVQVSVADGVLEVDTTGGGATYCVELPDAQQQWPAAALTVVNLRFQLVAHDPAALDGAFAVRVGDGVNQWLIGVRPDRLVHFANGVRGEIAFPPAIGQDGSLLDGQFHTLRIACAAGCGTAEVSVDRDLHAIAFALEGTGTPAHGLRWGDLGEGIGGCVAYDWLHWWHGTPGDILYQTSPSQMVAGRQVVRLAQVEPSVSYNPSAPPRLRVNTVAPTDLDKELEEALNKVIDAMVHDGWTPTNEADPGEFGKAVHALLTSELQHRTRWLMDAYVERGTRRLLSVGAPPAGVPREAYVQVDAIGLQRGYRPKVGTLLTVERIHVYEIKTSVSGALDPEQLARLRAVNGNQKVRLARSGKVYDHAEGGFRTLARVRNLTMALELLGLGSTAWRVIHLDEYESDWTELDSALRALAAEPNATRRSLLREAARQALLRYLNHFTSDLMGPGILALATQKWLEAHWEINDD
ncbi:MAG TPA: hypothetical protein PLE19_13705 [Planctomycetota bacterium]|nr:hypothetical protein [Planctomycetota bacterium]HRT95728.1 hypothetical protein [Planctomycetota bacterium]